jgi:indolepyruvate ferredoxin oxidoreductase alpha subunit
MATTNIRACLKAPFRHLFGGGFSSVKGEYMKKLLLGNEAIARGAYEAGAVVCSSYPGTPSSDITKAVAEYKEIHTEWAPNEKVGFEVAVGASVAGGRAITAMKHVGLNVAADPLFTASYTGVNAGLVVCVADDMGMHSSQNEQDSRHYANSSKVAMLEPTDSQDCKDFVIKGFELSEEYDTPVLVRLSTRISHSRGVVDVAERQNVMLPYEKNMPKYVMMPSTARARHPVVEERMAKLAQLAETSPLNKVDYFDKKIGVISAGIAYQYAREALGENASYLKLGMVHPLPVKLIKDFVSSVDVCYVIEELDPFIENHCRALGLNVIGKEKFSLIGEYTSSDIRKTILGGETKLFSLNEKVPVRPPVMCPGCSHRGLFYVLDKLKLTVTGDIGCYTLGALPPHNAIDTCLCMGAGFSMIHGMEKANKDLIGKSVGIMGDSTFVHSGITSLIDMVYNKGTCTVIILDNDTTGMTGHQDHPGTGVTIKGEPTVRVDYEALAKAIGLKRIAVVDPFDCELTAKTIKEEVAANEPSLIIARRPCILDVGDFKEPYVIDASKCVACGICVKIGCPAISLTKEKPEIAETQCSGCGLCASLCKKDSIGRG